MKQGHLFIFSAPSGSGKTSIVKALLSRLTWLSFSVSATTRSPRKNEIDGQDYYFLDREDFEMKIRAGAFVEWEEVYPGRYYGTLKSEIERILREGNSVVIDIDVFGGLNIKKAYGDRALSIFISPPDLDTLGRRLSKRGTETIEDLEKRIEKAKQEMGYSEKFDELIVNEILEDAIDRAEKLVINFAK
jgi:guanylate kinase